MFFWVGWEHLTWRKPTWAQTSSYARVEGKKISFAVVGTADRNTRHEAEASAPACVGLGIRADFWQK